MRIRLAFLALLLAVLAAPATASAAPTVGISDNRPFMFYDPLFTDLGVKETRLVMSWDVIEAAQSGDNELTDRVIPYLSEAAKRGVNPMIAFQHSRGNASNGFCAKKSNKKKKICVLPSLADYERNVTAFLTAFPQINTITAWNESNHSTQPTYKNAKRAGQYAKVVDKVCKSLARSCKVVVMDILDTADNGRAKKLKYTKTAKYIKTLRKGYGKTPNICGIHNYADVNRFRTSGTKALIKAMNCKQIWLTETGGFYEYASFWGKTYRKRYKCKNASACQVKAMNYLFKRTVKVSKRIKKVYVYNWFGGFEPVFDAGIVTGDGLSGSSTKRKAYDVVKKYM